jgi:PHD/YefM family antitoxin component YafN of YafNO toxin-antitoxin module
MFERERSQGRSLFEFCELMMGSVMSVRESVHQLVDELSEDRLAEVLDYISELNDTCEISEETRKAIDQGLDDVRNGRTISLDDYRRSRNL